jgi:hypothetical protein
MPGARRASSIKVQSFGFHVLCSRAETVTDSCNALGAPVQSSAQGAGSKFQVQGSKFSNYETNLTAVTDRRYSAPILTFVFFVSFCSLLSALDVNAGLSD